MSAPQVPPLSHSSAEFESDSDSLGTPIDPPSTCQPYVAGYEPFGEYCYSADTYGSHDLVPSHSGSPNALSGEVAYVGVAGQQELLLQPAYSATSPESCNQGVDSAIAAYQLITPSLVSTASRGDNTNIRLSKNGLQSAAGVSGSLSLHARRANVSRSQFPTLTLPYSGYEEDDIDHGEKVGYMSIYSKTKYRQPDLTCDTTALSYSPSDVSPSYASAEPAAFAGDPVYVSKFYYDESYGGSPIDDHTYCDRSPKQGSSYDQKLDYEHYHPHPQPQRNLHHTSNVRFYQPPSCHYSYPYFDTSIEDSRYGSSPTSSSMSQSHYSYPVIHAPRPQQIPNIHSLHKTTCPSDNMLPASHRVLSIPSLPAPPPIQRPSSLIEDSPKKPLTLACFFCRKRKIACQSPPANSQDRTCNQCAKRKLRCVYPATSRRGIRPRVYDLADETFRRPSVPLSL